MQRIKDDLEDAEGALNAAFSEPYWEDLYEAGDVAADVQEQIGRALSIIQDAIERL